MVTVSTAKYLCNGNIIKNTFRVAIFDPKVGSWRIAKIENWVVLDITWTPSLCYHIIMYVLFVPILLFLLVRER